MDVLIATDGRLDPRETARFAAALAGEGTVTVVAAIEVPRTLLADLRRIYTDSEVLVLDRESVEVRSVGSRGWPGDDTIIDRYLADVGETRTKALMTALRAVGVEPELVVRESENVAETVLESIEESHPDVVCIGAQSRGRFEGLLGSVGNKITRLSPCPVLLLRSR